MASNHRGEWDHEEAMVAFQSHVDNNEIGMAELTELRPWQSLPWKKEHVCKLKVGDVAPNSKLLQLGGTETTLYSILEEDEQLPTVLVFGSITCPDFRNLFLQEFVDIVKEHKGNVRLVVIYLAEAHPIDGWQVGLNVTQNIKLPSHQTWQDRVAAAKQLIELHPTVKDRLYIDSMDNTCDHDYEAKPSRAYVIHKKQIAYQSHNGPFRISPSSLQAFLWEWPVLKTGGVAVSTAERS